MSRILSLRPTRPIILALLALATFASAAAIACSKNNEAATAPTSSAYDTSMSSAYNTQMSSAYATPGSAAPQSAAPQSVAALAVSVRQGGALGAFLTGPDGKTLYVFTRDRPNVSNCSADCLATWSPLLVNDGQAIEASGASDAAFGRISTPSGIQVTFNGAPLYFYAGDKAAGDTNGNNIGGVWFVARTDSTAMSAPGTDATGSGASQGSTAAATDVVGVRGAGNAAFLVGPSGMTLYVFAQDAKGVSNCSGECIGDWPALTVAAGVTPNAADAAHGALDVLKRSDDGKFQVTYNGMPLYYFAADRVPGDTTGDGVGGVWSIARP